MRGEEDACGTDLFRKELGKRSLMNFMVRKMRVKIEVKKWIYKKNFIYLLLKNGKKIIKKS